MVARQTVSQETFDEAVLANIDEFQMEEDEAVAAAVEELTLQGADLSAVVKQGPSAKASHPLLSILGRLRNELESGEVGSSSLCELQKSLSGQEDDALTITLAVGAEAEAVPLLIRGLKASPQHLSLQFLNALTLLLRAERTRAQFAAATGASAVVSVVKNRPDEAALLQAAAETAEAAATTCEDNKTAFVEAGFGAVFASSISSRETSPEAARAVSRAVRKLTTADDARPVVSRAFQNSRSLASDGLHMAFLELMKRGSPDSAMLAASCCSAIKKLAVNDELCRQVADAGGAEATLGVLRRHPRSAQSAGAACGLLRQLAGSDAVKAQIALEGGLEAVRDVLETHLSSAAALEQAVGLLAALTLRSPDTALAAAEAGLADALLQVMGAVQQQWVQRQACIAIRNLVSRTPENCSLLREKGAEEALRQAKRSFPAACKDVGSAALRDLGAESYNDD